MKTNHILALLAIIAGLSAAFTNHAVRNNLYPDWNYEKKRSENGRVQYISPVHLAELIYSKEKKILLLDLRTEEAFQEYHLPSAKRLMQGDPVEPGNSDLIVLYGSGDGSYNAVIPQKLPNGVCLLAGGMEAWQDLVLFPDFASFQVRNRKQLEKIISMSRYFGGTPQNTQLLNVNQRSDRFREGC
jgi:hypothetical protein